MKFKKKMESLLYTSLISMALFYFIYNFISPVVSSKFIPSYKILSAKHKVEWNARIISTIHSVLVSSYALYLLFYDEVVQKHIIWGSSPGINLESSIMIGFMLADLFITFTNNKFVEDFTFVLHHVTTMTGCWLIAAYGVVPFYFILRVLAEMSTPFVNIRWHLDELKYPRTSKLFILNGFTLLFMFTIARILMMPIFYCCLYPIYNTEEWKTLGRLFHIPTVCVILDVFNIYWYYKLCRGADKLLRSLIKQESKQKCNDIKID